MSALQRGCPATLLLLVRPCRSIVIDNSGFSEARNLDFFMCDLPIFKYYLVQLEKKSQLAFTCALD